MGVYIKGMEMPDNCALCPMWDAGDCLAASEAIICEYTKRPYDCPLVSVPPHGDLIDRKPFVEFIKTHWDSYDQWFVDQLEARPTVIPADPAEEGNDNAE